MSNLKVVYGKITKMSVLVPLMEMTLGFSGYEYESVSLLYFAKRIC